MSRDVRTAPTRTPTDRRSDRRPPAAATAQPAAGGGGYESAAFAAASELARALLERRGRPLAFAAHLLAHPARVWSAARTVRRLPRIELAPSGGGSGRELARRARRRWFGLPSGSWAWGVLVIPEGVAAHVAGRRQLRRKCTEASRLGVACATVEDAGEQRRNLSAILAERDWTEAALEDDVRPGRHRHYAAVDEHGQVLAVGIVLVDADAAWIRMMLAVRNSELASPARYALSVHVIDDLRARGARHMLVDNGLTMPPGLQYFQARLGFEPMNVRVRRRRG